MSKDLKNALRTTRDMDEYLEVRSSQEIIDDIKSIAMQETLRDQFAAQALIGIGTWIPVPSSMLTSTAAMRARADWSYQQADAMLDSRADVRAVKQP